MTGERDKDVSTRMEMRAALVETRRYLLSHHEPSAYHRCHTLKIQGRSVPLCARCSGIYPGIAVGIGLFVTGILMPVHLVLVALFPLPALVDWSLTHFRPPDGSNVIRTATGVLLGIGYGLGLCHLLVGGEPLILGIGLAYGAVAAVALGWYYRDEQSL